MGAGHKKRLFFLIFNIFDYTDAVGEAVRASASLGDEDMEVGMEVEAGAEGLDKKPADHYNTRLSISQLNEEEIIEGVGRLGKALKEIYIKWSAG